MSRSFLWELEKLRREFGKNSEELKVAARELGRKRRGPPGYNDDHRLAQIQDGASARAVARNEGGSGAPATETRIYRKNRKQTLISQYWDKINEIAELTIKLSLSPTELKRYTELLKKAGPPSAPHLIMLDMLMCHGEHVLADDSLSADDRDHLERARFHGRMIRNSDLDNPVRREKLNDRIQMLEAILRELRAKST